LSKETEVLRFLADEGVEYVEKLEGLTFQQQQLRDYLHGIFKAILWVLDKLDNGIINHDDS